MPAHEHTTPPADPTAGGDYPEREEYSAAAPPDPHTRGVGETSFADATAAPASERTAEAVADWQSTTIDVIESADHFLNGQLQLVADRVAALIGVTG